jgi:hypothetical protein
MNKTPYDNLTALYKLFNKENFETYMHLATGTDHLEYDRFYWKSSIGGFATYHQIGGLKTCDTDYMPSILVDGKPLSGHDALKHVFDIDPKVEFLYSMQNSNDYISDIKANIKRILNQIKVSEETTEDDPKSYPISAKDLKALYPHPEVNPAMDFNQTVDYINKGLIESAQANEPLSFFQFENTDYDYEMFLNIINLYKNNGHILAINTTELIIIFVNSIKEF